MSTGLAEVTERLRREAPRASGMGRTAKLDLGPDGVVHLDARSEPPGVSNDDLPADATLQVSLADLKKLAKGELDPMRAMMTRRLKLQGDRAVALKLAALFQSSRHG